MSSKCLEFDCKYNKPVSKLRSLHVRRKSKIGKRKNVQVSGRCLLGAFKRNLLCPEEVVEISL